MPYQSNRCLNPPQSAAPRDGRSAKMHSILRHTSIGPATQILIELEVIGRPFRCKKRKTLWIGQRIRRSTNSLISYRSVKKSPPYIMMVIFFAATPSSAIYPAMFTFVFKSFCDIIRPCIFVCRQILNPISYFPTCSFLKSLAACDVSTCQSHSRFWYEPFPSILRLELFRLDPTESQT